jgi:hypothetical protein
MDFKISKNVTGLPFDLGASQKEKKLRIVKENDNSKSFDLDINNQIINVLKNLLLKQQEPDFLLFPPNKNFANCLKQLKFQNNYKEETIPWHLCMPESMFLEQCNSFKNQIFDVISEDQQTFEYYKDYFLPGNEILQDLNPAKINVNEFKRLIEIGKDFSVGSFIPDSNNSFAHVPIYSRDETVTGRLKTVSGPKILHVWKENRNSLLSSSRFGSDGVVVELDYKSLEPRVLFYLSKLLFGEQVIYSPTDVYLDIKNKMFSHSTSITRDHVKKAVLKIIYGGSSNTANNNIDLSDREIRELFQQTNDYFKLDDLKLFLGSVNNQSNKFIRSLYGRKINTSSNGSHVLVNYFIQSTSMDIVLIGFSRIKKKIKQLSLQDKILPMFVLTDALFLDVHKQYLPELEKIKEEGTKNIPKFSGLEFFIETKLVSPN